MALFQVVLQHFLVKTTRNQYQGQNHYIWQFDRTRRFTSQLS